MDNSILFCEANIDNCKMENFIPKNNHDEDTRSKDQSYRDTGGFTTFLKR